MFPTPSSTKSLCSRPVAHKGQISACVGGLEIRVQDGPGALSGAAPRQRRAEVAPA